MYPTDDFETGVIYCDDNLERLRQMDPESVDLIYLDPPFFSNRHYEVIWGDEAEVRSFEDRWKGGIKQYVKWMKLRVAQMHRVLKPGGSLYLHCDWHASHHLRFMLDGIFEPNGFQNEIIWSYRRWPSPSSHFQRMHDTIFFYAKSADGPSTFNVEFEPNSESYTKRFKGKTQVLDPDGGTRKLTLDAPSKGLPRRDVWDLSILAGSSKERLGYPTQKPETLLARIIEASTDPGDVVLDPFCGCGTTIAVAQQMQRRWIGIDISLTAAEIMKARVEKLGATGVNIKGEPRNEEDLRKLKPFEFQNWVLRKMYADHSPRKTGDMGVDGFTPFERLPIQVKRSYRVGRPVVDNFETAVERYEATKGYIVAFSFTKGAYEEVARVEEAKGLEIELIEAEDIRTGRSYLVPPRVNRQVYDIPKGPPKKKRPEFEVLVKSEQESPSEAPTEAA